MMVLCNDIIDIIIVGHDRRKTRLLPNAPVVMEHDNDLTRGTEESTAIALNIQHHPNSQNFQIHIFTFSRTITHKHF